MTLALYGKSRPRQVTLAILGLMAVLLAVGGGLFYASRSAFAHHISYSYTPPQCAATGWSLTFSTGDWQNWREAVYDANSSVTDNAGTRTLALPHRFVYGGINGQNDNVAYRTETGTASATGVTFSGFMRLYSGIFAQPSSLRVGTNFDAAQTTGIDLIWNVGQASPAPLVVGDIILVGNEVLQVKTIALKSGNTNQSTWTISVETRGGALTTPALHDLGDAVQKWTRGTNPESADANDNLNLNTLFSRTLNCDTPREVAIIKVTEGTAFDATARTFNFSVTGNPPIGWSGTDITETDDLDTTPEGGTSQFVSSLTSLTVTETAPPGAWEFVGYATSATAAGCQTADYSQNTNRAAGIQVAPGAAKIFICVKNRHLELPPPTGKVIVEKFVVNVTGDTTPFSGNVYKGNDVYVGVDTLKEGAPLEQTNAPVGAYKFVETTPTGYIRLGYSTRVNAACPQYQEYDDPPVGEIVAAGDTVRLCVYNLKMVQVNVCKIVVDNGVGATNEGGTFEIKASWPSSWIANPSRSVGLSTTEGNMTCDKLVVEYGADVTFDEELPGNFTNASGFPKWQATTSAIGGCPEQGPATLKYDDITGGVTVAVCNKAAVPSVTINGTKYHDLDADTVIDAGEPGLQGWVIWIDQDGDGVRDSGEPFRTTDANGDYSFANLPYAASYNVCEELKTGWKATKPVLSSGKVCHQISPTAGTTRDDVDFLNVRDLKVTFVKVICPLYSDVPANQGGTPDHVGEPEAEQYHSAAELGPENPGGGDGVTTPGVIPEACATASPEPVWTFNLYTDINANALPNGVQNTVVTSGVGAAAGTTVQLTGALLTEATGGDGLWVREEYQGSLYGFGEIKCYTDHLNYDNNEFILITDPSVTQAYCVAFNVQHRDITVKKVVVGEDGVTQEFSYTLKNWEDLLLATGAVAEGDADTYVVDTGEHTITESLPSASWKNLGHRVLEGGDASCGAETGLTAGVAATVPSGVVSYTVCFFNVREGELIVEKVNIGGDASESFSVEYVGPETGDLDVSDAGGPVSVPVDPGSYDVAEDPTPAQRLDYRYRGGYEVGPEDECPEAGTVTLSIIVNATVPAGGGTKVCVYNERLADLHVVKQVIGDVDGPSNWNFARTIFGQSDLDSERTIPAAGGQGSWLGIPAGGYHVTELNGSTHVCTPGESQDGDYETLWSFTPDVTTATNGLTTGEVALSPGESKTVYFWNRDCGATLASPTLVIQKFLDPAANLSGTAHLTGFSFIVKRDGVEIPESPVTIQAGEPILILTDLPTGTYTVEEVVPAGWELTGSKRDIAPVAASCAEADDGAFAGNPDGAELNLGSQSTAVFCFYNREPGAIRVHKTLNDDGAISNGAGWDFTLEVTGPAGCELPGGYDNTGTTNGAGLVTFEDLQVSNAGGQACQYAITETLSGDWTPVGGISKLGITVTSGGITEVEFVNVRSDETPTPTNTPETPTNTPETPTNTPEDPTNTPEEPTNTPVTPEVDPRGPTATPTEPQGDDPGDPTATPTVDDTAGTRVPGTGTPGAPSAGTGLFGESGSGGAIGFAILGLMALSAGFILLALGRGRVKS